MLFLIPIAHKIMLKIYSIGMIAFFVMMLIGFLGTDSFYTRYIGRSITEIIIAIVIDNFFILPSSFLAIFYPKKTKQPLGFAYWLALHTPYLATCLMMKMKILRRMNVWKKAVLFTKKIIVQRRGRE